MEHETERHDTHILGAKQELKQDTLTLRTSFVLKKKFIPRIKGVAKSGKTREGNTYENPLIFTFRLTTTNANKGWRDTVATQNETGTITRLGILQVIERIQQKVQTIPNLNPTMVPCEEDQLRLQLEATSMSDCQ